MLTNAEKKRRKKGGHEEGSQGHDEKVSGVLVWTEEDEEQERKRKANYEYRKKYQERYRLRQKLRQGQRKELWQKRSYKRPMLGAHNGNCPTGATTTNWDGIDLMFNVKGRTVK